MDDRELIERLEGALTVHVYAGYHLGMVRGWATMQRVDLPRLLALARRGLELEEQIERGRMHQEIDAQLAWEKSHNPSRDDV